MMNRSRRAVQHERTHFHPLAEQWLRDQGYESITYELRLGTRFPDFIAKRGNEVLIAECKVALGKSALDAIRQVQSYLELYLKRSVDQSANVRAALLCKRAHKNAVAQCREAGVECFEIETQAADNPIPLTHPFVMPTANGGIVNQVKLLIDQKFGGEDKVNLTEVQHSTEMTYGTVLNWYRGYINRVDFKTMAAWCKYLNCGVGDLLVYHPEH